MQGLNSKAYGKGLVYCVSTTALLTDLGPSLYFSANNLVSEKRINLQQHFPISVEQFE
jgi:hypothetical protein